MSNSALATYINRTCGNYTTRSADAIISKIMIHNAFAAGDRYTMTELINSGSSGYHYGISSDGVVGLYTDEDRAAFGCSNSNINDVCVHILVLPAADSTGTTVTTERGTTNKVQGGGSTTSTTNKKNTSLKKTTNKLTKAVLELLIDLVEDICRRNFIRTCIYSPYDRKNSTIICHSWYDTSTNCPGKLESYLADIASSVDKKLQTARLATESESLKARSTLAVGATKPFVVTPEYTATNIKYDELKELGVIGTMLWAGAIFNSNRTKRKSYANPNINLQVDNAKKYDMPWALYADVRARTSDEARLECRELYYVVSKHSPKLGIWLHLDFTQVSALSAKEIINIYYDKILEWGLKGRCGIYATKGQADLINWPQWTDKFAFWWIAMLDNLDDIDSILTPSLFQLR